MFWTQVNDRVFVEGKFGKFYFDMPHNLKFNINKVHPDLLRLTEIVLFSPWDKELKDYEFTRGKDEYPNIGLAFSGGVDSCAAYCLLPKENLHLVYHKRVGATEGLMKQDNPLTVIKNNDLDVIIIESNHEQIRTHEGKMPGFSTDLACCASMILLADTLELGYIATGMMLESTFIPKGTKYREFGNSSYWKEWEPMFMECGLKLFFPVMPCSEFLNTQIVKKNKIFTISCIRGKGKPCDACYKCFRKSCLQGHYPQYNTEALEKLHHKPIKQGASLIYAINKYRLYLPELEEYSTLDLSWLENFYGEAIKLIPQEYREYLEQELLKYTKPMKGEEIKSFDIETPKDLNTLKGK